MNNDIQHRLDLGAKYPYDAPDSWWELEERREPPSAKDWAHAAARGVIADLSDRRGIKRGFEEVDEEVREEIVSTLAAIIRRAHVTGAAP